MLLQMYKKSESLKERGQKVSLIVCQNCSKSIMQRKELFKTVFLPKKGTSSFLNSSHVV